MQKPNPYLRSKRPKSVRYFWVRRLKKHLLVIFGPHIPVLPIKGGSYRPPTPRPPTITIQTSSKWQFWNKLIKIFTLTKFFFFFFGILHIYTLSLQQAALKTGLQNFTDLCLADSKSSSGSFHVNKLCIRLCCYSSHHIKLSAKNPQAVPCLISRYIQLSKILRSCCVNLITSFSASTHFKHSLDCSADTK